MTDLTPSPATLSNPQDPLPEANWFWRRVFVFAVTAFLLFLIWGLVDRVGKVAVAEPARGIPALVAISKWMIAFSGIVVTYYLLAPSAEQITKLVKTASLLKSGVQVASKAVLRTNGRSEETTSTVGIAPVAPIPAPSEAIEPAEPQTPTPPPEAPWAPDKG